MSDPVSRYLSKYGGGRADPARVRVVPPDDDPVQRYLQRYGGTQADSVPKTGTSVPNVGTHPLAALGKKVGAGARGFLEMLTLGGSDEGAAAASFHRDEDAPLAAQLQEGSEPGGSFQQRYRQFKGSREQAQSEEPGSYLGGQVLGALAPAALSFGSSSAPSALSLMGRAIQAGKTGVKLGTASGALSTEGGIKERGRGAVLGGAVGGGAGAIAAPLIEGAVRGVPAVGKQLSEASAHILRGPAITGPAVGAIGGYMFSGGPWLSEQRARGAAIGSVAGLLSQQAGRAMLTAHGDFVPKLKAATGIPAVNIKKAAKLMRAAQKEEAAPMYQPLWQNYKDPITDPQILGLIDERPVLQDAFKAAQKTMRNFGQKLPQVPTGDGGKLVVPNPQMLHFMKVEVDKQIQGLATKAKPRPGESTSAAALEDALSALRSHLSRLAPGYDEAAAAFAKSSREMGALKAGFNAWNKGLDEIELAVEEFADDPEALRAFRTGLANKVYRVAGSKEAQTDLAKALFGTSGRMAGAPDKLKMLRALFPDEASYEEFVNTALKGVRPMPPWAGKAQSAVTQLAGRLPVATSNKK